jgi:hypothetical protein
MNLCAEVSANSLDKNPESQILLSHASRAAHFILKVRHRPCSWLRRRVQYTQIDSHAILVGSWLRKDERRTCPLCTSVLVHQAQLFELAYLVTHKLQLWRSVLAS